MKGKEIIMIKSRVEIIDLLNEYNKTQQEFVYQFWMAESAWSGKRQAYYSNGVVLGKFREKDLAMQVVLKQGVTDEALFTEIKQDIERDIKTLKNMDELDILYEARLNSDIELLKELSIDKVDIWVKKNCRWIEDDTEGVPYTEVRGLLFLYYAFKNFNYLRDIPYSSDIGELKTAYANVMGKQSQFHKYGVIPVDADRELISIDPPRIYDKSIDKTFFIKNVPLHLLKQISEMITSKIVTDFSVRLENGPGYEGRMYSEYIAEALERGKVFDLVNLGDYSVSKLYSEHYEDCMWVVIDSGNITFEELCEDIEDYDNMIVTQVVHLEYFVEHGTAYISHLDHEYVFYTLDEYEKRMNDPKQKGEAMTRLKSFKIDYSKIPFDYLCEIHRKDVNGQDLPAEEEQFLCYVLETYFKHKELLNEYFQKIKMEEYKIMADLTRADEIELILNFMISPRGYWEDEINKFPEAEKFITHENTVLSEEYEGLRILNTVGSIQIHEFIKKISEELIEYCERTSFEQQVNDLNKWFMEQYSLPDIEAGEDIAKYICENLYHYGYKVQNAHNTRKGSIYIFVKVSNMNV